MTMTLESPALLPGVKLAPVGGYLRTVVTREVEDTDANGRRVLRRFTEDRECRFPPSGMTSYDIDDMKRKAGADAVDFYDPRPCPACEDGRPVGWLRLGKKPEHNHTILYGVLAQQPASEVIYLDEPEAAGAPKGGTK